MIDGGRSIPWEVMDQNSKVVVFLFFVSEYPLYDSICIHMNGLEINLKKYLMHYSFYDSWEGDFSWNGDQISHL